MMKLGDDPNYVKPAETVQDIISKNPELLQDKLKDHIQIHPNNYKDIEVGTWVKYVSSENKYRSGGVVMANYAPEYLSLKNPYKNVIWTVDLTKNIIFIKELDSRAEKRIEKDNLYKLYLAGFVKIVDPDEEQS